jgi:predicted acyltransferase
VAVLAVFSLGLLAVPVPGFDGKVAAGVLEPGRDAGAFVDRWLLDGHLWAKAKTWDPEGLVSTLPAVATLLFGVLAGSGLLASRQPQRATIAMVAAGFVSLAAGLVLDALLMPINKNLWTPSYCLFMNGWALLVFAAFYWLIDGNGSVALRAQTRRWLSPLTIYGMNALFLFALSGFVARLLGAIRIVRDDGTAVSLKAWLYAPLARLPVDPAMSSLAFAILFDVAMFAVAWWMWKKRWFVSV